jgi:CheY-like chemotaxis protein
VLPMPSPPTGTTVARYRDGVSESKPPRRVNPTDPGIESVGQPAGGCQPDGYRLLIVDDDVEVLTLVSRMAACLGYGTCTAASGEEALLRLQNDDVDLVITDYQMPLMDGFQLAAQIRRQCPNLPVIMMTGNYSEDLEERIQSRDLFDGLLKKPSNLKTLGEQLSMAGASLRVSQTA